MNTSIPAFEGAHADLALSGLVYGVLVNDPALLAQIGDAIDAPPYKGRPRAPVIYIKPRNTHAVTGSSVSVDRDVTGFTVGATLGLVIGRTASRVGIDDALDHLAGYLLVVDLTVPHQSFYRPSVRYKARDRSCLFGSRLAPIGALDPDDLALEVAIDGQAVHRTRTAGRLRPAARLLADVTEFMTLRRGDVLLTGLSADAPVARAGQRIMATAPGLGEVRADLVAETTADEPGRAEAKEAGR